MCAAVPYITEVAEARSHGGVYVRHHYDADVVRGTDPILANTTLLSPAKAWEKATVRSKKVI